MVGASRGSPASRPCAGDASIAPTPAMSERGRSSSALGCTLECCHVSADQGFLLRPAPALELALPVDRLVLGLQLFKVDKLNGQAVAGMFGAFASVVLRQSVLQVGAMSDIKRIVRALQDVDEEFHDPIQLIVRTGPSTRCARSGHSTRAALALWLHRLGPAMSEAGAINAS